MAYRITWWSEAGGNSGRGGVEGDYIPETWHGIAGEFIAMNELGGGSWFPLRDAAEAVALAMEVCGDCYSRYGSYVAVHARDSRHSICLVEYVPQPRYI